MTELTWDEPGTKLYETGIDHGVLYIPNQAGEYFTGFSWDGLTAITESPSGGEANAQYADNLKYLNLLSIEEFSATLEAFSCPLQFASFDGFNKPIPGISIGQQKRRYFGLSYRTVIGNDLQQNDYGYKIHLLYGVLATPSEKNYTTISDSPEPISLSWELTTTPVRVPGFKPSASIVIDSTKVSSEYLTYIESILYGGENRDPRLPLPEEVFGFDLIVVIPNVPELPDGNLIVITPTTGVIYRRTDTNVIVTDGVAISAGELITIRAYAATGYVLSDSHPYEWEFEGWTNN